jgi:HipA-like protein
MNNAGLVYYNDILAGRLVCDKDSFIFTYNNSYLENIALPPISLSFPKSTKEYQSPVLFPFFYGLLAEGANKQLQCAVLKIDENDHFTRLLKTAGKTTIGAISVQEEI